MLPDLLRFPSNFCFFRYKNLLKSGLRSQLLATAPGRIVHSHKLHTYLRANHVAVGRQKPFVIGQYDGDQLSISSSSPVESSFALNSWLQVDTHIHAAACMNQRNLLQFIRKTYEQDLERVVQETGGKKTTLRELFQKLQLNPDNLDLDALNMRA
eukprot:g25925.t1